MPVLLSRKAGKQTGRKIWGICHEWGLSGDHPLAVSKNARGGSPQLVLLTDGSVASITCQLYNFHDPLFYEDEDIFVHCLYGGVKCPNSIIQFPTETTPLFHQIYNTKEKSFGYTWW